MLVIRMQRVGRSGHAQFRVVAQDSRFHPSSGRVVAYLGSYNPHTKEAAFQKEKIEEYLSKGAQPSERLVKLLLREGFKLPKWVAEPVQKQKSTRNPEKLSKEQPAQAAVSEEQPAAAAEEPQAPSENEREEAVPAAEPAEDTASPAAEEPSIEPEPENTETEEPAAEPPPEQ